MLLVKKYALVIAVLVMNAAAIAADVDGLWKTAPTGPNDVYIEVEIAPCSKNVEWRCGVVTAFFAEGEQHEDELVGKWIIENMKKDSDVLWKNGTVWAPDNDKSYRAKMKLTDPQTLKVSGCLLGGFLCRGEEWSRVP